jgi:hypothetical protein
MQPGQPSLTALGAARLRAAHQVLDGASILAARFFPSSEHSASSQGGHITHAATV